MKSYFVAALSFVGILGSAAGAMAINNDTLTHGADLTDAASASLIHTATVSADGTVSAIGVSPGNPGATPSATAGSTAAPATPPALTNLPTITWNGTTSGSAASSPKSGATSSAARPVTTPAAGVASPVNAISKGSASAAPAPSTGGTGGTGSTSTPQPRKSERQKGSEHGKNHEDKTRDNNESEDD